jgi:sugar phosphate isomerase/epimerase
VQIKGKSLLNYPEKLDWKVIFQTLQKDGYEGKFGLETHIFGEGQVAASHSSMQEILRIVQEL